MMLLLSLLGAGGDLWSQTPNFMQETTDSLAARLDSLGYEALFLRGPRSLAPELWDSGSKEKALQDIARDDAAPLRSRFLAMELLVANGVETLEVLGARQAGRIYTEALTMSQGSGAEMWQLAGNNWGFLAYDGSVGPFGEKLLQIGEEAVPFLLDLLDNADLLLYEGSQEATLGNALAYRKKDAAAYLICRIVGLDWPMLESHEARDAAIDALKSRLD